MAIPTPLPDSSEAGEGLQTRGSLAPKWGLTTLIPQAGTTTEKVRFPGDN